MVKMDENRKKQQQAREKVRFLRRRMLESSFSKLSAREIEERCNKPEIKEISELSDVLRPECSLWLKEILADLRAGDPETRLFALGRFLRVFDSMVTIKGAEICAGFSAYVLERGVLSEIKGILKAAQSKGDFYLFPSFRGIKSVNAWQEYAGSSSNTPVISKVSIAFDTLHALMVHSRTTRFVEKVIPDLIELQEGVYLSGPMLDASGQDNELGRLMHEREKRSVLWSVGSLAAFS